MKTIKLSDFYPYDRNKGGIQELHHKIESKTLQYWGEDSGILIGITPIYKIRLWSEEVKVVNDKMTNMKTRTYEGVQHGDWVRCVLCGAQMLLPCGADKCPECGETGYSKEEFDKIDEKNKNPELTSINTFNDTVKKANEIKDRVLKYVYNIKQERSYNNDMVGIFERYKDIADGDLEVAMNFIKEAYPFNEETESFIRKKFDMPIPNELEKQ